MMPAFCALLACVALARAEILEGTLDYVRPAAAGALELELVSGTNHFVVKVENAGGYTATLASRVRVPGATASGWNQTQILAGLMQPMAWTVVDLRRMGANEQHAGCVAHLGGQVLAVSPNGKFMAFADATGVELLEFDSPGRPIAPGEKITIEGNCMVEGVRAIFRSFPMVDDNDIHAMTERSGSIYLTPGRHALRLDWFNHEFPYGLEVYYEGPGLPRQRIPDSVLFRRQKDPVNGQWRWASGLDYRCYEGNWLRLPDFDALWPAKEGTAANFDTSVFTRTNDVGLEFKGYIEAPREGMYKFSTISDDGALMFMDEEPPKIEVTGTNALPKPAMIGVRQSLWDGQEVGWAEVEGTVTFVSGQSEQVELELSSDTGRMRVEVADSSGMSWPLLQHCRIRATGICLTTRMTDGQTVAGAMLAPGMGQIEFLGPEGGRSNDHPTSPVNAGAASGEVSTNLPVLTQVQQIKRLPRDQWLRGYPVKMRGVVTTVMNGGVFIQDSTGSIYARWRPPTDNDVPRVGDYWEIEGKTFAEFAPNIQVTRAVQLGFGTLPEPLRPAWDQLINGSLDTAYIEVQGIVTAANSDNVTVLTRTDKIQLDLIDVQPQALAQFENALVRVRGCVIPVRDDRTQKVEPGRIRLSNGSITVDEPAPKDPFDTPLKHASDFLLFDWRAGAFQRVKITGQILHKRDGEYFIVDGKDSVKLIPKAPMDLRPGDLLEAVGYLELGGSSPILREAVARQTGQAEMPEPQMLNRGALLNHRYEGMWVKVQAQLVESGRNPSDDTLEMQCGTRGFVARLKRHDGRLPALQPGSTLELTGVYRGLGDNLAAGSEVTSFELLLNSPDDVKVLARPPWWTLGRALDVLCGMILVILVALVWIALLRRKVEERSRQLATEIHRHEQTERQRELEEERSRIAQDLHDDLGAALTQIRFLSVLESRDLLAPESTRTRMGQITEKSREMVASLDEIVWAINPTNDSLASLVNYLCHSAEEFFNATPIRCRLDVADAFPAVALTSEVRHHLYLAVREALNNIGKHSGATEVWLRIQALDSEVRIELEDNGRGFPPEKMGATGEGLANMRLRLAKIGGRFECESNSGAGAICRFVLRLEPAANNNSTGLRT